VVQLLHAAALLVVLNEPAAQAEQARSVVLLPSALTDWPAWQWVQVLQLLALEAVLKLPALHASQLRSVVVVPAWSTEEPAAHCVQAMQPLAALASWSQAPAAQGAGVVRPPGQYVPAAHAVHSTPDIPVPGPVW
jgi:hypothetical protein